MSATTPQALRHLAAFLLLLAMAGCGGGGGGGGGGGPQPLQITTNSLPDGVINRMYAVNVPVTGGTGGRTFGITAGALPPGVLLNASTGQISGLPIGPAGTANFTVGVTDSGTPPLSDAQAFSIDIGDEIVFTTTSLPVATIGVPYNQTVVATGGIGAISYSVSGVFALPDGLTLSSSGVIAGTPTATALTSPVTIQATDSASPPQSADAALPVRVTLEIVSTAMPDATIGVPYSEQLVARGGRPPYTNWSRTAGSLPAGIADPTGDGVIAGTPVGLCAAATSTFSVQASDSDIPPMTDAQAGLQLAVGLDPLDIVNADLPDAVVGAPYTALIEASGGSPPYTFVPFNDAVPDGLTLDASTGQITGTATTEEFGGLQVRVTDSCGAQFTKFLPMDVVSASQGRNDSIATATPIGNGSFDASISPSGHPNSVFDPDEDYYRITTTVASTVTINMLAQDAGSPIDTVIEIVGANGARLNSCVAPAFTSSCMHDDEVAGVSLDSFLEIRVNGPATFYLHVVDWRFDGRPDLTYNMTISGIN